MAPTDSVSTSGREGSLKVFELSDAGSSNPEIFRARLLRVELCRYCPADAQNFLRLSTERVKESFPVPFACKYVIKKRKYRNRRAGLLGVRNSSCR